jgi:membrane-associated PAP2 superfamily phosphatase
MNRTAPPAPFRNETRFWHAVVWVTLVTLALLLALEQTTIDLWLARLSFDATTRSFPLREHFVTTRIAHDAVKLASAGVFIWIAVGVWRPLGVLRRLDRSARVTLLVSVIVSLASVALLKRTSALHCPWGLSMFGGAFPYLRLFDTVPGGWSRGACFPAGHALSAFAYIGGFFAFRAAAPRIAWSWLGVVLAAGAFAGIAQQLRGAHFLSHTLWTGWLCWTIAALLAWVVDRQSGARTGS